MLAVNTRKINKAELISLDRMREIGKTDAPHEEVKPEPAAPKSHKKMGAPSKPLILESEGYEIKRAGNRFCVSFNGSEIGNYVNNEAARRAIKNHHAKNCKHMSSIKSEIEKARAALAVMESSKDAVKSTNSINTKSYHEDNYQGHKIVTRARRARKILEKIAEEMSEIGNSIND